MEMDSDIHSWLARWMRRSSVSTRICAAEERDIFMDAKKNRGDCSLNPNPSIAEVSMIAGPSEPGSRALAWFT
jgi:hypothetical protein